MANTIRVTAGAGRHTPIDRSIATAAGDRHLFLKPGEVIEVDATSPHIVRQLRDGDLALAPAIAAPTGAAALYTPKES